MRALDPPQVYVLPADGPGRFVGRVDPSWHQGRGSFGGLLAAAIVDAAARTTAARDAGTPRPPRSLHLHFAAPARGDYALTIEPVRLGSRVSTLLARVTTDNGVAAIGTLSLGRARAPGGDAPLPRWCTARRPDVPPPEAVAPTPTDAPGVPAFVQYMDFRFCHGSAPWSGATEPEMGLWLRTRAPATLDAPMIAMLLDAPPPTAMALTRAPTPAATVDLTMHFFAPAAGEDLLPGAFAFMHLRSRWADDGYVEEVRDLYAPSGALLGECRQLVAML
jgi:acyl-CoA thioesterase